MVETWVLAAAAAMLATATGFVVVAVLWLRRLRHAVTLALGESVSHQLRAAQRLGEAIEHLRKQQNTSVEQIQVLAQANIRLRHELSVLAGRLEPDEPQPSASSAERILH